MFKHSFRNEMVKYMSVTIISFVAEYIVNVFDDYHIWCFALYDMRYVFRILIYISTVVFLIFANIRTSTKAKLFPKGIEKVLNIFLFIQMILTVGEFLFRMCFEETRPFFDNVYDFHMLAFALFFVLLYLYNKNIVGKTVITISATVCITLWVVALTMGLLKILSVIPVLIVLVYMFYSIAFPTISSGFYYRVYYNIKVNDKNVKSICVSAYKNERNEIELLLKTRSYGFFLYNRSTRKTIKADSDLMIQNKTCFYNDMVSFMRNSMSYFK